jgi:hypothetical protein
MTPANPYHDAHRMEYDPGGVHDPIKGYDPFDDMQREVERGQEPKPLIDALRSDPSVGRPGDEMKGQDA